MAEIDYWEIANVLRGEAEYQDFKYGSTELEWELGYEVITYFLDSLELRVYSDDTVKTFMGIPIRVNMVNPQCIKLWREVKV